MTNKKTVSLCIHCGGDKSLRNPIGDCDHLHYPDNCPVCVRIEKIKSSLFQEIENRFGWWKPEPTEDLPRIMRIIEFEWRDFVKEMKK